MSLTRLGEASEGIRSLRAVFVIAMPDCLLYDFWQRVDGAWNAEEVASYFGDLTRANRSGLKALGAWSSSMQVTIEAADALVLLREIGEHFVCAAVFDREAPLGMVRLHSSQLIDRLASSLPQVGGEEIPRGVRILRFLERYAPDPHAVIMRLSVRAGLTVERLREPHRLSGAEIETLEREARSILGLERLEL